MYPPPARTMKRTVLANLTTHFLTLPLFTFSMMIFGACSDPFPFPPLPLPLPLNPPGPVSPPVLKRGVLAVMPSTGLEGEKDDGLLELVAAAAAAAG